MKIPDKQNEPSTSSLLQVKKDTNPSKELKNEGQGPSTVVIQRIFDQAMNEPETEVAQNAEIAVDENNNPVDDSSSLQAPLEDIQQVEDFSESEPSDEESEQENQLREVASITSFESEPLHNIGSTILEYDNWRNIINSNRIYLNIPYEDKEEAKDDYNAWWDPKKRCWHIFKDYSPTGRHYPEDLIDQAVERFGLDYVHNDFDFSNYDG